jgi:phosphatidylserine/phosphatidylglycerophosphate/cardiolipin synthase-like enzyme
VSVVADPGFLHDRYTKIAWLAEEGIPVYMYDPKSSANHHLTMSNIMHHKFVIFLRNREERSLIWTGSFNFTKSARLSNQENVVVLASPVAVERYLEKFEKLKKSGILYSGSRSFHHQNIVGKRSSRQFD